jgi:hypothetical protein
MYSGGSQKQDLKTRYLSDCYSIFVSTTYTVQYFPLYEIPVDLFLHSRPTRKERFCLIELQIEKRGSGVCFECRPGYIYYVIFVFSHGASASSLHSSSCRRRARVSIFTLIPFNAFPGVTANRSLHKKRNEE